MARLISCLAPFFLTIGGLTLMCLATGTKLWLCIPGIASISLYCLLALCINKEPICNAICLIILGVIACLILQIYQSPAPILLKNRELSVLLAFFLSFVAVIQTKSPAIRSFVWCLIGLAAAFHLLFAGIQHWKNPSTFPLPGFVRQGYVDRVSGGFNNPNHLGAFLSLCLICLGSHFLIYKKHFARFILSVIGCICLVYGIMLTRSRGTLVSLVAAVVTCALTMLPGVLYLKNRRNWRIAFGGLFSVIFVSILGFTIFQHTARARFASNAAEQTHPHLGSSERQLLRNVCLQQFASSPLFGTGPGTFPFYEAQLRTPQWVDTQPSKSPETAHCDALQFLAEYGILGAGFTFVLLTVIALSLGGVIQRFAQASGQIRNQAAARAFAGIGSLAYASVHSWFDFAFHAPANMTVLGMILGVGFRDFAKKNNHITKTSSLIYSFGKLTPIALCTIALLFGASSLRPSIHEEQGIKVEDKEPLLGIQHFQKAWDLQPMNALLPLRIAGTYRRLAFRFPTDSIPYKSFLAKSLYYLKESERIEPTNLVALRLLGITSLELGQSAEAGSAFERALEFAPNHAQARADYILYRHYLAEMTGKKASLQEVLRMYDRFRAQFYTWRYGQFDARINAGYARLIEGINSRSSK